MNKKLILQLLVVSAFAGTHIDATDTPPMISLINRSQSSCYILQNVTLYKLDPSQSILIPIGYQGIIGATYPIETVHRTLFTCTSLTSTSITKPFSGLSTTNSTISPLQSNNYSIYITFNGFYFDLSPNSQ